MKKIVETLQEIERKGLYRQLRRVTTPPEPVIRMDGREVINFCSNNYLGLANDPRLKEAALQATEEYGIGSGAARLISGNQGLHEALEEAVADFKGTEGALLFNSGYQANIGVIPALAGEGDWILSDEWNHASLIDGCRLSKATTQVYRHGDLNHLEGLLRKADSSRLTAHGRRERQLLIVTESLFSMEGDLVSLPELIQLAERYDAWVYLDEAHATGVFGQNGSGLVEHFFNRQPSAVSRERLIQMGTFSKGLGSFGAYVAGTHSLRKFLINRCRSFIFATSLPPGVVAASLKGIEVAKQEPERREHLWRNIRYLAEQLSTTGRSVAGNSPIFPLILGRADEAIRVSEALLEKGCYVQAIRPPTVPKGTSRLRLTLMATHTKGMIDQVVEALNRELQ